VIALATCRQNRALFLDPIGREAIRWTMNFDEVNWMLRHLALGRLDPGSVALAEQDSWQRLGQKYARLYREVSSCPA
jgi:hypothetical protein